MGDDSTHIRHGELQMSMGEDNDVRRRLQWLRREHPDAELASEHVRLDDTTAIFRVVIVLPSGGKATGYGSEKAKDFGDFVERAETRAISRALDALGYASAFVAEARPEPAEQIEDVTAAPSAVGQVVSRVAPAEERRAPTAPSPAVAAGPSTPVGVDEAPPAAATPQAPPAPAPAAPIDFVASRDRAAGLSAVAPPAVDVAPPPARLSPATTPTPPPASVVAEPAPPVTPEREPEADGREPESSAAPAAVATVAAEPALEDYSFTVFWRWARGLGYNSKGAIEDLIGRPIKDLTPLEVRNLVLAARGEA